MKTPALLFISLTLAISSLAQNVYWADTLLEVSSEKKMSNHFSKLYPNAFNAEMVLGKPNIMPGNEGTTRVWAPKSANDIDFIKVGFNHPIKVKQLAIAEVFNPSAISDIFLYTIDNEELHVDGLETRALPLPGRLFHVFIDETEKPVKAVTLVLNGENIPGHSGIDAIAISDSYEPVQVTAKIALGVHTALAPEKMDNNINSPFKEIKPLLSPDGNTMYFSRIYHPENTGGVKDPEDIWKSDRDPKTGEWGMAYNAGPELNNNGPNFIASITPAGYSYRLLLGNEYKKNGEMKDGLSITTRTSEGYIAPEKVEIKEYQNFSEHANFYLATDGQTIVMSIQRDDTQGDRDIYVSFIEDDGKWSVPLNLGAVVNTGEEESCPYLASDGKTLFFSSKGHLGYGNADVFISRRLDDTWTNWSEPENLGTAVNSKDDDLFFYLSESDTKYAYFTRGTGNDADTYRLLLPIFQLPEPVVILKGRVLNSDTKRPIGDARVSFKDLGKRVIVHREYSEPGTGRYMATLPLGKVYELYANALHYISIESQEVDLSAIFDPDTIVSDILLDPVEIGKIIGLDKIYFDVNRAQVRKESEKQLDLMVEFLRENPSIEIEIKGYADSTGTEEHNFKLSVARANSTKQYLTDKGIKPKRISTIGLGEAYPIETNETEEGRAKNRRVEFVITKND
ncbi:MAG: OmpA family protein [Cyclobacteriaceae bacterium]|nr:OmpA family protein [Cyclobacteriaceae bacterium]